MPIETAAGRVVRLDTRDWTPVHRVPTDPQTGDPVEPDPPGRHGRIQVLAQVIRTTLGKDRGEHSGALFRCGAARTCCDTDRRSPGIRRPMRGSECQKRLASTATSTPGVPPPLLPSPDHLSSHPRGCGSRGSRPGATGGGFCCRWEAFRCRSGRSRRGTQGVVAGGGPPPEGRMGPQPGPVDDGRSSGAVPEQSGRSGQSRGKNAYLPIFEDRPQSGRVGSQRGDPVLRWVGPCPLFFARMRAACAKSWASS